MAGSDVFSQPEWSALAFAERMTQTGTQIPEDVFTEARRHFPDRQLVELAAAVATENYRAWGNRAFLVESRHFYHSHRDQLLGPPSRAEDIVTEASKQSFPASDAPAWIHEQL